MLNHLRERVIETIAPIQSVTLSTYGPAELQASLLPGEASGMNLYVLIPTTSDHLVNLEIQPEVLVTTPKWQMRGLATVLDSAAYPHELKLPNSREAQWSRLVGIRPTQLNIRLPAGWGFKETIDIENEP